MLSFSQPTYAYKIYRNLLHHFQLTNPHNLHMHTRYIRDGQPLLAGHDLTTYICIQDISYVRVRVSGAGPLTTYICIQDISGVKMPLGVFFMLTTYICIQDISTSNRRRMGRTKSHNLHMHTRYILCITATAPPITLTTYICIQDISSNKYKYKLPTRIKFVGFIPCREYLLFYIRNLCILSRLKDAEPPLISVRISYVFFVCFSFALLIFKVFSIISSIFFIPIF